MDIAISYEYILISITLFIGYGEARCEEGKEGLNDCRFFAFRGLFAIQFAML